MLRDYQQKAIDQLYAWFENNETGNPCLVLPTGSGKSHIIAALVKDAITNWPETRVLMLTHQKELIVQNAEKMREHWRNAPMGIYSASLNKRVLTEPITFAGIQSVANKGKYIGHVDLVIVDECHAINHSQTGSYRKLLNELITINPQLRVVGLSATPYRLGHGYIHQGDDVLFNALIEPVLIQELVERGFLSPLRSKYTDHLLSTDGVKKQGGEWIVGQLEKAIDTHDNNLIAVLETIRRASDRKSWLFFCAGIDHAQHVAETLISFGISAECVTGATPIAKRDQILMDFKSGRIRAITNVNVLTTGFDYPGIDCLIMLRPTLSPGLYVQMAGRGMRIADDKTDCLVLDFAGNVSIHGPITNVEPPSKISKGDGEAPTKTCPECYEIVAANTKACASCGYEFPIPEKAHKTAFLYGDDIMGIEAIEMKVTSWRWMAHTSRTSGKEMLKVNYYGGLSDPVVTEYFPVLHDGYSGEKSRRIVYEITSGFNSDFFNIDLKKFAEEINDLNLQPQKIKYRREGKFYKVESRLWD